MPGETKDIKLMLPSDSFSVFNDNGEKVILPGSYLLTAGGGQPSKTGIAKEENILKAIIKIR